MSKFIKKNKIGLALITLGALSIISWQFIEMST